MATMKTFEPDCYQYVRDNYKVPAYIGVRVTVHGHPGVLVPATEDLHYIHVWFDGASHAVPAHPTADVQYHETFSLPQEVRQQIGPTHEYPLGRLDETDEGELAVALGIQQGKIVLRFGALISWLAMSPEQAIMFAEALKQKAAAV